VIESLRELVARQHRVDAGRFDCFLAWMQARPEHAAFATLVERQQKQRRSLRAAIEEHDRARFDDSGQIEELIVLPKRLLAGPFGRPLDDGHRAADAIHDPRPPRGEFLGGEDLGAGEDRLPRQPRRPRRQYRGGDERDENRTAHRLSARPARL
jgi:hypothetical protein